MIFKHFRAQLILRIVLLLATAFLLDNLFLRTDFYETWILLGLLLLYQVVALVRYAEGMLRDLTRFLESVRYGDFSQRFRSKEQGPLFDQLAEAFEEVTAEFRSLRAEREEHARYLQNVVRHVGVALIAYRAGGEVELINEAARRLFEMRRVRRIGDLSVFSEPLVEKLSSIASGRRELVEVEHDSRALQLAVYVTRFQLRGEDYALASVQDIRSELEDKEMEAWQRLTRVLTHEIMNSIAPIASLANRLMEESEASANEAVGNHLSSEPERRKLRAAEAIHKRSEALLSFVDSFRSFTKLPQPELEMVAAEKLLHRVRRLLSAQIEERELSCEVDVTPSHLKLTADPQLIEQVLINLLLNAIQAVEGQPDARIDLRASIDRQSRPVIVVADNGPGIPEDVQKKIFVPFFTTKEDGSGIGLSLARQIMRLHGGTLTMRSEPGRGATFTLRF